MAEGDIRDVRARARTVMFIYYFAQIDRPFVEVEHRMFQVLAGFDDWAAAAYREGEKLNAKVGPLGGRTPIAKTVAIRLGDPRRGGVESSLPLTWEATGSPGLFPRMEGELVVAALGPDVSQLSLRGSYEPPLGALGRALDRTLLHRIAEASVKSFVDRVAMELDSDESPAEQVRTPGAQRDRMTSHRS